MPSSELLYPVWQTYIVAKDCLKIARRVVLREDLRLMSRTGFVGQPGQQAVQEIEESINAIEDFAIIGFWAHFERRLIEYSQNIAQTLANQHPVAFSNLLHDQIDKDIEYWKTDNLLDVFKSIVDSTLIGQAKQIKEYRDWISHRNPKKLPSAQTDAATTYQVLSQILDQIDEVRS